eukprot:CAMPEP_0171225416 /NCGR_PEP_ID=MMETSP0790-20130122/36796_1 /TAXON_ID=2925 /ORGANISM="Alexandrium catenella, Strain OF101" /LENGTH=339 /DNA_ID=CAMNT_0011691449 /DNA_START=47 /DNA_END=1066 /DNA_ORIENTATION=+
MARLLELLSILAVAAAVNLKADDSVALTQWNHRVSAALLESGAPEETEHHEVHMPDSKNSALDILRDLPGAMEKAFNTTDKLAKSSGPGGGGDLGDMMKMLTALFDAVRSDTFMGNITWVMGTVRNSTKDAIKKGAAALEHFTFVSRTAKDKEMLGLVVWLFNNFTNTSLGLQKTIGEALNATKGAFPDSLNKMLSGFDNSNAQDDLPSLLIPMPENTSKSSVCHMSTIRLTDLGKVEDGQRQATKHLNGTKKMLPMLKDYMDKMRPEVAPRVVYLLTLILDTMSSVSTLQADFVGKMVDDSSPVLKARLGCQLSFSGSSRAGLGLLAVAALLLAWFEL